MMIRNETSTLGNAGRMALAASRLLPVAGVIGFALLTALAAKVQVPLVPVQGTMQTVVVLLAGMFLGPFAGAGSQALYIGLGLAGLPVFAGPVAGPAYLFGPTGGYLAGFILAATVAGLIAGPGKQSTGRVLAAAVLGTVAVLGLGVAWLATVGHYDAGSALAVGAVPFLPREAAKCVIVLACTRIARGIRIGG